MKNPILKSALIFQLKKFEKILVEALDKNESIDLMSEVENVQVPKEVESGYAMIQFGIMQMNASTAQILQSVRATINAIEKNM